jgi:sec-independent protein translocase protein TatA
MFGSLGWPEVILILVVLLLVFGVGRITKIGSELGSGLKAFKDGLSGDKTETPNKDDKDAPREE